MQSKSDPVGIVLVNKPSGITSHDVVDRVRGTLGIKKVGHAGTLDPLASGLLIVLIGKAATKLSEKLSGKEKSYTIGVTFGFSTDSLDTDGEVTLRLNPADPILISLTNQRVQNELKAFEGTYPQQVPWFSAVKVDGKKLYQIARAGKQVESGIIPPTREVTIFKTELVEFSNLKDSYPTGLIETKVSSGTYTRSLVRDLGKRLGIPTVQHSLVRTSIGGFNLSDAVTIESVNVSDIIPIENLEAGSSSLV